MPTSLRSYQLQRLLRTQSLATGSSISITASASDSDGSVTKVEFFEGTTKLGEDLTAPYTFIWNNVPEGSYSLNAVATDNENGVSTSESISHHCTQYVESRQVVLKISIAEFLDSSPLTVTELVIIGNGLNLNFLQIPC
jgi:hypothetical protein